MKSQMSSPEQLRSDWASRNRVEYDFDTFISDNFFCLHSVGKSQSSPAGQPEFSIVTMYLMLIAKITDIMMILVILIFWLIQKLVTNFQIVSLSKKKNSDTYNVAMPCLKNQTFKKCNAVAIPFNAFGTSSSMEYSVKSSLSDQQRCTF